jgi:NAD-dependent dihydropyrimidine dehydrogenase PreA subunit
MIETTLAVPRVILYEGPRAEPLEGELRNRLLQSLLERGYAVRRVRGPEVSLDGSAQTEEPLILGRFGGRLPPSKNNDVDLPVRLRDITGLALEDVLVLVETLCAAGTTKANGKRWKPWFPVIDYSRCTNCMQCLSFCLFGVYGASPDGKIQVQHESNCKTDCPACSRVCPEVAIMFPKYKAGPINGDAVSTEDVRREAMKIDISALLGGDIYSMLRDRSARAKSRFSKERDDDRALQERQRCLEKLKTTMDGLEIPPEVLASLPSPDQIQEKAAEARWRAQQALAQSSSANNGNL